MFRQLFLAFFALYLQLTCSCSWPFPLLYHMSFLPAVFSTIDDFTIARTLRLRWLHDPFGQQASWSFWTGQWLCAALAGHRHDISFNSSAGQPGPSIPHLALGYKGFILWHDAGVLYRWRLNNVLAAASNLEKACCAQKSPNLIGNYNC